MSIVLFQHSGAGSHILGQNELMNAFLEPECSVGVPQRIDRRLGSVAIGFYPGGFQQGGEGLLERPDGCSITVLEVVVFPSSPMSPSVSSNWWTLYRPCRPHGWQMMVRGGTPSGKAKSLGVTALAYETGLKPCFRQ